MAAPLRISIFAPDGQMGKALALAIAEDPGFTLDQDKGQLLIDFSVPAALPKSLAQAIKRKVPLLIGTTGLEPAADAAIAEAAKTIAILRSANTSLAMNVLAELVERAAKVLGTGWDIEIAEAHHRNKADAPSGTALMLGEAAAQGRGTTLSAERGRDGTGLARGDGTIGFASLRGGTVAGDHDVMFLGPEERLILSHRAESRLIFARGALAAARFLSSQKPGLYTMRDVVDAL
ncbi:MAG: 4-hydroxy-tetrahydrodipicolinate reductase [Sphingomicrobium sp.]